MTWDKRVLWSILRDRCFHCYKFRRQMMLGNYIVGFYHNDTKNTKKSIKIVRLRALRALRITKPQNLVFLTKFLNHEITKIRKHEPGKT